MRGELAQYLDLVGSTRAQDVRRLRIGYRRHRRARDLFVSYVSEVRSGRSTYRLVILSGGRASRSCRAGRSSTTRSARTGPTSSCRWSRARRSRSFSRSRSPLHRAAGGADAIHGCVWRRRLIRQRSAMGTGRCPAGGGDRCGQFRISNTRSDGSGLIGQSGVETSAVNTRGGRRPLRDHRAARAHIRFDSSSQASGGPPRVRELAVLLRGTPGQYDVKMEVENDHGSGRAVVSG